MQYDVEAERSEERREQRTTPLLHDDSEQRGGGGESERATVTVTDGKIRALWKSEKLISPSEK